MNTSKLGDIASYINGYPFKPSQWNDEGKEIIRIQNLTNSSKERHYFLGEIDEKYIVKPEDILISWSATLGVYEWKRELAVLNQHIFKVVFDKKQVNKKYFKYAVGNALLNAEKNSHGSTMKHLTKKNFENIELYFPSIEVQEKISTILDLASEMIYKRKKQLAEMDKLEQSYFYKIFGNPITNEKRWKQLKIRDISVDMKYGTSEKSEEYKKDETDIPIIRIPNIKRNELDLSKMKFLPETSIRENQLLKEGDLLFVRSNGNPDYIGRVAVIDKMECKYSFASYLIRLRIDRKVMLPKFLGFMLSTENFRTYISSYGSTTAGNYNINTQKLKEIRIIVPSIEEQYEFLDIIEEIESQKKMMEESLHEMEDNFNALTQKTFNGELFPE